MTIKQSYSKIRLSFILIFLSLAYSHSVPTLETIQKTYQNTTPHFWGDHSPSIITKIHTSQPYIFLTLDACSGKYDQRIINLLRQKKIPAMLFINARWIKLHSDDFLDLAKDPLFSIQNHGFKHKPLSVNGKSAYHIQGTQNIQEVYQEIMLNDHKIQELTGKKPRFFRSGTAYYDEIALQILSDLGYQAIGFDVLGDAGATFSKEQIIKQTSLVTNGSILIYHFNHPEKATYDGLKEVIEILEKKGFIFKNLSDFL